MWLDVYFEHLQVHEARETFVEVAEGNPRASNPAAGSPARGPHRTATV
jgi:hypothetical protein